MLAAQSSDGKFPSVAFSKKMTDRSRELSKWPCKELFQHGMSASLG